MTTAGATGSGTGLQPGDRVVVVHAWGGFWRPRVPAGETGVVAQVGRGAARVWLARSGTVEWLPAEHLAVAAVPPAR